MLKINYHTDLKGFERKYLEYLKVDEAEKQRFAKFIYKKIGMNSIPLELILVGQFEVLFAIANELNFSPKEEKWLELFFNYDKNKKNKFQPKIKAFFEHNLPMKTCYYCNLDFVNVFNDTYDFHDSVDFVKKAGIKDLCKIEKIEKITAGKIHGQKANIHSIDDLTGINAPQKENLKNLVFKEKHSHFTLDHVLDKKKHPLLALSLYNFVPSCYACNSKFKGNKRFIDENTAGYLSPTGKNFSFNKDVKFKLFFKSGGNIGSVVSKNDFVLDFDYSKNKEEYEKYINTFKLKGRYVFHKDEIVNLVEKKKRYSSSKIEEMAKNFGIPASKVKEDLFGKELFHGNPENKSMTKFKRDIANNIGIKGVL